MGKKIINHDVIVLGVGGMGSSVCYHLAKRGLNVLGLEQFAIPHHKGSSHGETRVIRKAYFEHPDYVPLLSRSYELWGELEKESGQQIFNECGLVVYADKNSTVYRGISRSSKDYNLPLEEMGVREAITRWPVYKPDDRHSVLYEPDAGFIYSEKAILSFVNLARRSGATIKENQHVLRYDSNKQGVIVKTDTESFAAKKLVITAGAWSAYILEDLRIPFTLLRKNLSWHNAGSMHDIDNHMPCALFEVGEHLFYMFPMIDKKCVKIGKHTGGEVLQRPEQKQIVKPDQSYLEPLQNFIQSYLPEVSADYNDFVSCIYTNTPDGNFVIDIHPRDPNIIFACGFSGHGFKFASVIGEIMADLTVNGKSDLLKDFIKLRIFEKPDDNQTS